jgi:hypothetical protein
VKQKAQAWIAVICLALASSGCATAISGTSQTIQVGSTPEGAECVFTREGETLGKLTTPGPITVKRDKRIINVVCTKDGHEEARAALNSLTNTIRPVVGFGIISAVAGVATLVDMASGADTHYQTALMVKLEPLSAADQAAAVETRARAPAEKPAAAAASLGAPFDGEYEGDVELVQRTSGGFIRRVRHIEVRVSGGVGEGTVKHPLCDQPGKIELTIDSSGTVKGTANTVNTDGCVVHKATLVGRVEGKNIRLTLTRERFEGWTTDFSLSRKPSPTASAAPARP